MEIIIFALKIYSILYTLAFILDVIAYFTGMDREVSVENNDMLRALEFTLWITSIYSWWL